MKGDTIAVFLCLEHVSMDEIQRMAAAGMKDIDDMDDDDDDFDESDLLVGLYRNLYILYFN